MIYYIFLFLAVVLTALGQTFYKLYKVKQKRIFFVSTIITFLMIPIFSILALKHLSIDVVYISTAFGIILVVFFSKILLNEKITFLKLLGLIIIFLGVLIYVS